MITEAREALALALAGVGVPVHVYPPGAVQPPAIVIIPGEPYLEGYGLARGSVTIRLQVQCMTVNTAPESLDALLWAVQDALVVAGYPMSPAPPPRNDVATGNLLARIPVTMIWKD